MSALKISDFFFINFVIKYFLLLILLWENNNLNPILSGLCHLYPKLKNYLLNICTFILMNKP